MRYVRVQVTLSFPYFRENPSQMSRQLYEDLFNLVHPEGLSVQQPEEVASTSSSDTSSTRPKISSGHCIRPQSMSGPLSKPRPIVDRLLPATEGGFRSMVSDGRALLIDDPMRCLQPALV